MSRRGLTLAAAPLLLVAAAGPGLAQDPADRNVETMLDRARQAFGPASPDRPKSCGMQDKSGDIVVCAPGDDRQHRVQSSTELDPTSRQATRTGVPRAPDLAPKYPGMTVMRGCIVPPCAKPPMYMIDLSSIPETPPGSDAEKVANGEMRDR